MQNIYNFLSNNLFIFLVFPYIVIGIFVMILSIYRKDKTHSISKVIASSKKLSNRFSFLATIGSISVYLVMIFYLIPKYNVNFLVSISAILMYIFQTIFVIIPDRGGLKSKVHEFFAFLAGFLTVIYWLLILLLGTLELSLKIVLIQYILIMGSLFIVLVFSKRLKKYIFLVEVIFLIEWIITIFCLSFAK